MAELADAHALGACAERHGGSSPSPGTRSSRPPRPFHFVSIPRPLTREVPMANPAQPNIKLTQSTNYREDYANSVQIRVNVWDFFLVFGTLQQQSPSEVEVTNFQGIYLSPQQAKALLAILEQNVVNYEKTFGEIKLDPRLTTGGVVN